MNDPLESLQRLVGDSQPIGKGPVDVGSDFPSTRAQVSLKIGWLFFS